MRRKLEKSSIHHHKMNTIIISVIASVSFYVAISIYTGWSEVLSIFFKIGWTGLVIALLLSLLNYLLRFGRWQFYLTRLNHNVPLSTSLRIYLSGFSLTTTPGKAGEAIRSLFLRDYAVPVATSVAALISERLSDLLAIVLLSCLGLTYYEQARLPIIITTIAVLSFTVLIAYRPFPKALARLAANQTGKFSLLLYKLSEVTYQTQKCHSFCTLLLTTLISIIAWGAEGVALYFLLSLCGYDISLNFAIFIYSISILIGALTFLPGGLGSAEAVMIALLLWKGLDTQSALAVTIFIRLTTLWFAVILGIFALYRQRLDKGVYRV